MLEKEREVSTEILPVLFVNGALPIDGMYIHSWESLTGLLAYK